MNQPYYNKHDFDVLVLQVTKEVFPGSTVDNYKPGNIRLYHLDDSKGHHITPFRMNRQQFCIFLAGACAAYDKGKHLIPDYLLPVLEKAGYTGSRLFDLVTEGKV